MKIIDIEELKQVQLEILADVHQFCQKRNIRYSLAFGSLLGAVRHKGYIPWDDDIDIMMPRSDYENFLKWYGNERYQVANSDTMDSYFLPYAKVYDTRTWVEEFMEYPMEYGVNIDVFPLDNLPDSDDELKSFLQHKQLWNCLFELKRIKTTPQRLLLKNSILVLAHMLLYPVSIYSISKRMRKLSEKYADIPTRRIGIVAPSDNNIREIWDRRVFDEYTLLPFEGINVQVMKNYHQFLTAAYGDYKQLPPKEKRVSHHSFKAFWKD